MDDPLKGIRARIIEDRSFGVPMSLAEYARLFPGQDVLVAQAYADVYGVVAASPVPSDTIAHYRIVKELGRGGQGVVYLAEDTRLHRKVALKVLTGLGPRSEDSVHRLRREAEVASKLDHPGICGVHDAGVANGTPYIAMHYVEGWTLADRISERKSTTASATKQEIPDILRVLEKAAQALHAAHEVGIIHRDIKPGNIMVTAGGQPVILDFGLARAEDMELQTLTRTGDVFGTPAYMSPEQISGQRIRLDRRSDVYSLGVTLYECLTLRRPFEAPTREGVYQAVMTKSPPDPRKINPAISKDLKVVVETALEKDRDRRYATADALARDLEAVLEGRPIQARPVGPVGRFVRWSKREPAKAALLGVLFVALPVIATLVTSHVKDRPQVEAARLAKIEQAKDEILSEASLEVSEGDPKKAVALYTQVLEMEGTSPEAAGGLVLAQIKLKNATVALELLEQHKRLLGDGAAANLLRADALSALGRKDEAQSLMKAAPAPQSAFEHQIFAQKALQSCGRADKPTIRRALHHATTAILLSQSPRLSLYALRAHAAAHAEDRTAIVETAAGLRRWADSPKALYWCGFALSKTGEPALIDESVAAYREVIRLKPDAFWAMRNLGIALEARGLHDEAIAAFRGSIRFAPKYSMMHCHLGEALLKKGLIDEAIPACREAIRLDPDFPASHAILGDALIRKGLLPEGIAEFREAIRLRPTDATFHAALGTALSNVRDSRDEGIAECREAIRLKPDDAMLHLGLGNVLSNVRDSLDEGIAEYREAIRLSPDSGGAHCNLGRALLAKGLLDDAIAASREAIRLLPGLAASHHNLGLALSQKGLFDEAIAALREAIRLNPSGATFHVGLGQALTNKGLLDEAIAAFREGIRLNPDDADAPLKLAGALTNKGQVDEAIATLREAIRLRPDNAGSHVGLGRALFIKGLVDESIDASREAIRLSPGDSAAHSNLGSALFTKGHVDEAIAACRESIRLNANDASPHKTLASSLFVKGLFLESLDSWRAAIRLDPNDPESHVWAGNTLASLGLDDDAIAALRQAILLRPDFAEAHCTLGQRLTAIGEFREALEAYRACHELGSRRTGWRFPTAQVVAQAEQRVADEEELEDELASHLAAGTQPADTTALVRVARVALKRGHPLSAARWYKTAFEEEPEVAHATDVGHRRLAARAAVLASIAGSEASSRLDDAARSTWRLQALEWLEAEIAGIEKASEADRLKPPQVRIALVPLVRSSDLASVRAPDAIAKLPDAERARWTKLWADIDALLSSLDRKPESRTPETRR